MVRCYPKITHAEEVENGRTIIETEHYKPSIAPI